MLAVVKLYGASTMRVAVSWAKAPRETEVSG
jgi:hypothetical protein